MLAKRLFWNRDVEEQDAVVGPEVEYPPQWTRKSIKELFLSLSDSTLWNTFICFLVLAAFIMSLVTVEFFYLTIFYLVYNVIYAVHVLNVLYYTIRNWDNNNLDWWRVWQLNDYHMNGSVLGTALKYCYIFVVLRIVCAVVWIGPGSVEQTHMPTVKRRAMMLTEPDQLQEFEIDSFYAFYVINKIFIPIGPSVAPSNDLERVVCLLVMIMGGLLVTGVAVASLSLVFSIYMRPEETFRARYRLIMKEMTESSIPPSLRAKVQTFYMMYWHKQRAVSATQLLPIFPPSLPATIYTDIYFKATQKCRILRDLSYQFLTEVAKKMETIHFIPGDSIIKRLTKKSSIIYMAYGDIEMLTAEDDSTAMLRMVRGSILSPCAGCPVAGSGRAHVQIRAATFCTAHVLHAADLWKTTLKYGRTNGQGAVILGSFYEHFERVKRHYLQRLRDDSLFKSSILHFKRNLMNLKGSRDSSGNLLLSQTDVLLEIAGCYIMRNRADASLTDESDAICLRPTFPCILQPKSSLQVAWHSFVTCLIIAVCITHPYYLVYMDAVPLRFRFYDYMVTLVFVLDLVVHLSTGAHIEDGVPITLAQTSSQQARSRWFVLDVLGTLPIFEIIGNGHFAGINKLLRLPKVFRMLKVLEDECVYHSNLLRFLSYSLLLLVACYLMAALQQGFMCFHFGRCDVSNFTHSPYWHVVKEDDDKSFQNEIVFSLYWAISMITLTAHKETWTVLSLNNIFYTMFVLEICIILHIFIEAVYSATISVTSALEEDYDACIENVTNFLVRNEVDPMLRHRFITYLQLCWYTDKAYSMTNKNASIFYDLPSHVYQDIVARQRIKYILCIPFMKLLHKEDLKNVSSKARLFYTSPNEILLNTGDIINEMYVIKQGICEILSPVSKDVVGKLDVRSHFGVLECLLRIPAFYTIRAATHVQIFSISRKNLLNAIEIPQIKDAIEFAKEQPEYTRLQKRYEPFTSYRPLDLPPNMERFLLPRKHEPDYVFLHPFQKLGFLSVLRYMFPRFTIRPDSQYLLRCEWFRACCALLSATIFPGYTYLVLQWPGLYFVTVLLDFSAYFDILQRMLVGYYNEQGILVYHPTCTAAYYLKGAFMVDLFACLPLERLEAPWKESYQNIYRIAPTQQFLMLNRLLQLYRTPSALIGLTGFVRRDILFVIRAIPLFLALLNVLTCFVVFYSANIFYSILDSSWSIVPHKDTGGSWIDLFRNTFRFNITENPYNLHLASYFWVVYETTTTGYGSFKPTNIDVMKILIIGMIIGALITTYFSVRIISMRANVNKTLAAFQHHMKDIAVYMAREKLPQKLKKEVLEYYEFNWDKMGGEDYRSVFKLCDQITLRTDAILNVFGPTFTKCPILSQCDVSLLRIIGRAVGSNYFLKGTSLVEVDDIISDIFFIDQGSVEVQVKEDQVISFIKLTRGSIFGNLENEASIRCPVSMTSTSEVHLLKIKTKIFYSIVNDFPVVRKLLSAYRPNNENYIVGKQEFIPFSTKKRRMTIIEPPRNVIKCLHVKNSFIQIYLISVSLFCVYLDVYNAGFQVNGPFLLILLYILDFGFYWKFVIQYFLPQISEAGDVDMHNLVKYRKRYFKFDFYIDLLSALPFEVIPLLCKTNPWMAFSWLRLNRLLRIATVYKTLKQHHERISINLTMTIIFTVFIWFTLFVHVSACLWYFIGVLEEQAEPKSSWFYQDSGEPWCDSVYVCSLYFVLTTFTQNGVGDILPKKQSEVVFVSILQIISTLMYMIYVGEFSNIIQYQSFRCFKFYSQYLELQEFLKNNRVSKNLVSLVNKCSIHLWREARGVQVPYFLQDAPKCLKLKVMSAAYMHHLTENFLFSKCEPAFLRQLVGCLKLYTYNEGMYVVQENEITASMYFIHFGRVLETCDGSNHKKKYHLGQYFGMFQGLMHNLPYPYSYRTVTNSQVLTLYLKDWEKLLKHFPNSKKVIYNCFDGDNAKPSDDKDNRDDKKVYSDNIITNGGPQPPVNNEGNRVPTIVRSQGSTDKEPVTVTPKPRVQKTRSGFFIPPPGPEPIDSQPLPRDQSFIWPTDYRASYESYSSFVVTENTENTTPSVKDKVTKSTENVTINDIIDLKQPSLSPEKDGSRMQQIEKISDYMDTDKKESLDFHKNARTSDIDIDDTEEAKTETDVTKVVKFDTTHDFKSVEDYITEHYGDQTALVPYKKDTVDKTAAEHSAVPSTSRSTNQLTLVHYEEADTSEHMLEQFTDKRRKSTRNLTKDEKNLRTLDSDMHNDQQNETDNIKSKESSTSVNNSKSKTSHEK